MNPPNLFDLTGRVAIITGGAGLLGSEHAIALHAHGATIILADFNVDKCQTACDVLAAEGITDLEKYSVVPGAQLYKDLFV